MAIWTQPSVPFLASHGCDSPPEVAVLQEYTHNFGAARPGPLIQFPLPRFKRLCMYPTSLGILQHFSDHERTYYFTNHLEK